MIKLRLHDCLQGAAFIILQTNPTPLRHALVALAQVGAKSFVFVYQKAFKQPRRRPREGGDP
jgi:hypothetical protein